MKLRKSLRFRSIRQEARVRNRGHGSPRGQVSAQLTPEDIVDPGDAPIGVVDPSGDALMFGDEQIFFGNDPVYL